MRNTTRAAMGCMLVAGFAQAAGPDVAQVLTVNPIQIGATIDTPTKETEDRCKLEVIKNAAFSGWQLKDSRNVVVRLFLDTNKDNVVDQWSFYFNGQEVYRDVDTNFNGKADQHRWFYTGGSRWAVDANEDGRIDSWKAISAEEASGELIRALTSRDFNRFSAVLLQESDLAALGIDGANRERIAGQLATAKDRFTQLANRIPQGVEWTNFDGHSPMAIPAADAGAAKELEIYHNATIIASMDGKSLYLRATEIVRVGDVWKLTDVPAVIENEQAMSVAGILLPQMNQLIVGESLPEGDAVVEDDPEIQKHVAALQKLDQESGTEGGPAAKVVAFHAKRAELCAMIGSRSQKLKNREHWYKQTADSLNAAVQTGEFAQGIQTLQQYSDQFAKQTWGKQLAAYFRYRALNAAYGVEISKPGNDPVKAQEGFLAQLVKFMEDYPEGDDVPDALWQLGNGMEFANKESDAKSYYTKLAKTYPQSTFGAKAEGALRRLDANGNPIRMVGNSLTEKSPIDLSRYSGKVLLVSYWATWCEPCKAEMPRLAKLREKYADQGFEVVGVCLDNEKAPAEAFLKSKGFAWPQIHEEGGMECPPAVQFGIISLPYMMLIDEQGRVINANLQFNQLENEVEKAIAKRIASRSK